MIFTLADACGLRTVSSKRLLWFRVGGLPEGVSEVHTPPFQLFGVVRRHVGKLPEDVEVRGVS